MNVWRLLGSRAANRAERAASGWVCVMFFACLASTFLLRPLRDQFGVDRGVDQLPYLYSLTLLATIVVVLPFWWLANRMPSRRFVPWMLHLFTGGALLLAVGLSLGGGYDWSSLPLVGEVFWGGYSALNVAVPALVWIHAVEHFGRDQARRQFGLIAVGGTAGAVCGSWGARSLADVPVWVAPVCAAILLQLAGVAFLRSLRHGPQRQRGEALVRNADGGVLEGLVVLFKDTRAMWIAVYMVLFGVVSTAFYTAQTELLGAVDSGRSQYVWLANKELLSQLFVLLLQLFFTGRLLSAWSSVALLASLPAVSMLGLGVWWLAPTASAIFCVEVVRRGARFALEKPAREALYTPFDLATKHKVKFLLDTFAYRLGDLLGALLQVGLRAYDFGTGGVVAVTVSFALLSIAVAACIARSQASAPPTS